MPAPEPHDRDSVPDLDRLYARLEAETDAEERQVTGWLRSRSTGLRLTLWLAVGAVVVAVAVTLKGSEPFTPVRLWTLSALLVGVLAASTVALRPLHRGLLPGAPVAAATALGVLGLALAATLLPEPFEGVFLAPLYGCARLAMLASVPPFLLGLALDRDPPRGLAFGALGAALVGTVTTHIVCPAHGFAHLATNHGAVLVGGSLLLVVVGALLRRLPSMR